MEITQEMVTGYTAAVAAALEAAGHKVTRYVTVDAGTPEARLVIADALTDDAGAAGLALMWSAHDGWDVAVWDPEAARAVLHTDLELGVVPAPEVVVRAVAAIVADGQLRAGRVVPGAAELLAAYAAGTAQARPPATLPGGTAQEREEISKACRMLDGPWSPLAGELRNAAQDTLAAVHAWHRFVPETAEAVAGCSCGDEWACPQVSAAHRLARVIVAQAEERRIEAGNGWLV